MARGVVGVDLNGTPCVFQSFVIFPLPVQKIFGGDVGFGEARIKLHRPLGMGCCPGNGVG
jgi:hypothetical protein